MTRIANSADVNQADMQGFPPLFYALFLKREAFVQILLNNKDIDLDKTYKGISARLLAASLRRPL